MRSWKSTIGGAFSAFGTTLMGVGVLPMVAGGPPSQLLAYIALTGFILNAIGTFCAHLFSADRSDVRRMFENSEEDTKVWLRGKVDVEPKKDK